MEKSKKEKRGHQISSYTTKSIVLTHAMLQTAPLRRPSSLSFSLPNKTNYLTSWTKKYWVAHQTPHKGFHLLKGFISPSPFILKYSFLKWLVCWDSPFKVPKLKEHKFVLLSTPCTLLYVNKLTICRSSKIEVKFSQTWGAWYNPSQQGDDQGLKLPFTLWEVISTFKWRPHQGSSRPH